MPLEPTPLRALGTRGEDGCVLLRDVGLAYRDGSEEDVLRIIAAATDLGSSTDDLIRQAEGWAQTYHLHPSRANVVRCLDLPATARVLEIGAGCGAITRYLGESCASVDALEPVPGRAAAARARTRDLDNVEVFVGELADVPTEPAYDLIVVIGVLEYIANGGAERGPYLDFLRGIHDRLADGGALILAIENQLGVKYLAGAPEDHSNRMFDSIEGYPADSPARTFSRRQLQELFVGAGLDPAFLVAFPDYKITRAVLGDFPDGARSLLHRIPQFPSPDWMGHRPRLADEYSMWRSFVEAGLEFDTGNSFLVLAGKDSPAELWPSGVAGVFYSVGRRAAYTTETIVQADGDSVLFRRHAVSKVARDGSDELELIESEYPYADGEDLLSYVARDRNADVKGLLTGWATELDLAITRDGAASLDLVPHNIVVGPDQQLHPIDVELSHPATREQVIRRGVYWMAYRIAPISGFDRWPGHETVRELACYFGTFVGLDPDGAWLDVAIDEEAAVQAQIHTAPLPGTPIEDSIAKQAAALRGALERRLADMPLGRRLTGETLRDHADLVEDRLRAEQRGAELTAQLEARGRDVEAAEEQIASVEHVLEVLEASLAMRVTRRYRRGVERVLPTGTRRRGAYERLAGRSG
jgi:SAM-dependent methyltransferase